MTEFGPGDWLHGPSTALWEVVPNSVLTGSVTYFIVGPTGWVIKQQWNKSRSGLQKESVILSLDDPCPEILFSVSFHETVLVWEYLERFVKADLIAALSQHLNTRKVALSCIYSRSLY